MDELDVGAIRIDHESKTPPFEQVRAHVAQLIASGGLSPGAKLPTVRQLAGDLDLAVNTAGRVYRELEADGLVATNGRRGTRVRSEITEGESQSDVARRAREAAGSYVSIARRIGLTRAEAIELVEQSWQD